MVARPLRPEPRFIFKDRQASDAFVTRVRARPVDDNQRREIGPRGRDPDGTGVVAPPHGEPRPRPITGDQSDKRDRDRPRERRRQPDAPAQPAQRARPAPPERQERPEPPRAEPRRGAPPPTSRPRGGPEGAPPKDQPRAEPGLKRRHPSRSGSHRSPPAAVRHWRAALAFG